MGGANSGRIGGAQDVDHRAETDAFLGASDSREGFLRERSTIETCWRIFANVAIVAVGACFLTKIVEQYAATTDTGFGIFSHAVEAFHIDVLLTTILSETFELNDVGVIVKKERIGRIAIAPSTSYLLVVALNAFGKVVVDDPAHVALVDTHTKCYGGNNDLNIIVDKCRLCFVANIGR